MKAQELVNNGTVTVEELLDFANGDNWEHVQESLNKATGFEKTTLDFNTDEDWDTEIMLNAELIESAF